MRSLFSAMCMLLLSACAMSNNANLANSAWDGKSADFLVKQRGAPQAILPGDHGTTLWVYVTYVNKVNPQNPAIKPPVFIAPGGRAIGTDISTFMPTSSFTTEPCTTTFTVNQKCQIIAVKTDPTFC